ncbi:DNA repair protein XRCC4 isoform X1 [Pseudonaja textilis]|uniref:DNA repair protein XRCC4 isoform X1 n=1 Tax=Pseudonaja textilis TaxID=8673 RepID=UPI000EA9FD88|nr:DNA repair protein XRCC4 isoform X1 [Pseudonaja textilis]XP_026574543.1 DNA repair protein XRCC4 isoform X1 [Pseudonaja textilis]XP_026574550.1 DNA repair protein XRCC4 isoform X1 [Pseudonaja textilis]
MEKKMRQLCPISDPDTTYFLQITWCKDLGMGFDLILSDGQSSWTGRVSEEKISREAADMEMKQEKYVEELKKVLLFDQFSDTYRFDISKKEINGESIHFSYEKNLKDVTFRLGSLKLQRVTNSPEVIRELIIHCLDCVKELHAKNDHLQKENERLLNNLGDMQEQLQKCVEAKEELETDLYKRFVLVLNEKKTKIRSLLKHLKEVKEMVPETAQARDTVIASKSTVQKENYEGSTDEESENLIQLTTSESIKPRRDPLLGSPDITDIVPSRKRRQLTSKNGNTKPKVTLQEAQTTSKETLHSAPSKSMERELTLKKAEEEKSTGDPEDLFDDI